VRELTVHRIPLGDFAPHGAVDGQPALVAATVAVVRNTSLLYLADVDNQVTEWDAETGRPLRSLGDAADRVNDIVTIRGLQGPLVVAASLKGAQVWDVRNGEEIDGCSTNELAQLTAAHVAVIDAQRSVLLLADRFGCVEHWHNEYALFWRVPLGRVKPPPVFALTSFRRAGRAYAAVPIEGRLQVVDLEWARIVCDHPLAEGRIYGAVAVYRQQHPYVAVTIDNSVLVIDPWSGETVTTWTAGPGLVKRLVLAETQTTLRLVTLDETGRCATWEVGGDPDGAVDLDSHGNALAVGGRGWVVVDGSDHWARVVLPDP
jgi:hypothetical protein